jgi:hypothetical protein
LGIGPASIESSSRKEFAMMHCMLLPSVVVGTLFLWELPHKHTPAGQPGDAAEKMFERIKALAGEWERVGGEGDAKGKTLVSYRVTAGGSAVLEVIFPGTEMEMVSVYHRDGNDLVMTHYCMMGNQPKMRARPSDDANRLVFEFIGGTNLNPAKDPHIHGGVIQVIDRDHIRAEWDYYSGGKVAEKHGFELARKL